MSVSFDSDNQDMKKEYAAVLIPTLCRYEHFCRCISSLKANRLAAYTDVYIGLDYPSKASHEDGYKAIKRMLDNGIDGFANVFVFRHEHNLGGTDNLAFIREEACRSHKKFIYAEDDNEFSPNYLEYMNELLDSYEADDGVFAVSGYNYPIRHLDVNGTVYTNNIYVAAFGVGFWTDKYREMDDYWNVQSVDRLYRNISKMTALAKKAPNQFCNFVRGRLGYLSTIYHNGDIWKIDLMLGLYMYATGRRMIYPVLSKVRNWGFDGSGENCTSIERNAGAEVTHRNIAVDDQLLDNNMEVENIVTVNDSDNELLKRSVNDYFDIPRRELVRAKIAYYTSLILGTDIVGKLLNGGKR